MFTIRIYYKYAVKDSFFEEVYEHLTEDQANKIKNRFNDEMKNGDYVAMQIITEKEI